MLNFRVRLGGQIPLRQMIWDSGWLPRSLAVVHGEIKRSHHPRHRRIIEAPLHCSSLQYSPQILQLSQRAYARASRLQALLVTFSHILDPSSHQTQEPFRITSRTRRVEKGRYFVHVAMVVHFTVPPSTSQGARACMVRVSIVGPLRLPYHDPVPFNIRPSSVEWVQLTD